VCVCLRACVWVRCTNVLVTTVAITTKFLPQCPWHILYGSCALHIGYDKRPSTAQWRQAKVIILCGTQLSRYFKSIHTHTLMCMPTAHTHTHTHVRARETQRKTPNPGLPVQASGTSERLLFPLAPATLFRTICHHTNKTDGSPQCIFIASSCLKHWSSPFIILKWNIPQPSIRSLFYLTTIGCLFLSPW